MEQIIGGRVSSWELSQGRVAVAGCVGGQSVGVCVGGRVGVRRRVGKGGTRCGVRGRGQEGCACHTRW